MQDILVLVNCVMQHIWVTELSWTPITRHSDWCDIFIFNRRLILILHSREKFVLISSISVDFQHSYCVPADSIYPSTLKLITKTVKSQWKPFWPLLLLSRMNTVHSCSQVGLNLFYSFWAFHGSEEYLIEQWQWNDNDKCFFPLIMNQCWYSCDNVNLQYLIESRWLLYLICTAFILKCVFIKWYILVYFKQSEKLFYNTTYC